MEKMDVTIGIDKGFSSRYRNVDESLGWMADHGVTSLETYVLWQDIEPHEGAFAFDRFDRDLEAMRRHGLRWVPFLIAGPWYSTPQWFRTSPESLAFRCLEHDEPTGTQSIWNPHLWPRIAAYLAAFRQHYSPVDVESVLLGVTGDYGEAIFPVHGNWGGEYHGHQGYWCGDAQAIAAFRHNMRRRHRTVTELNQAWGSHFRHWEEVRPFRRAESPSDGAWLELIEWYQAAMSAWSDRWMQAVRKLWPETQVYLCTGGDMIPAHGSQFVRQAQVAASVGGGVRITNEGSDFLQNLLLTRLVTVSTRHYGAYAGIEPAARVTPEGIAIRMFNAIASGARQLHEYAGNLFENEATDRMELKSDAASVWTHNYPQLQQRTPHYPVALAVSNTFLTLGERGIPDAATEAAAVSLRAVTDFALVDETLIADGILDALKVAVVVLAHTGPWTDATVRTIQTFLSSGGIVLTSGIPHRVGLGVSPWVTEWTGETEHTRAWRGITAMEALDAHPVWASTGPLAVNTSVSGLSKNAEVLLQAKYQPHSDASVTARPDEEKSALAVLWRVRHGKGASYLYTGSFAVDPRSWMQQESILTILFRYLSAAGAVRLPAAESETYRRTAATAGGLIRLTLDGEHSRIQSFDQGG